MAVLASDVQRMTDALYIDGPLRGRKSSKFWILLVLAAVIATALHIVVLVTHPDSHLSAWAAVVPFIVTVSVLNGESGFPLPVPVESR